MLIECSNVTLGLVCVCCVDVLVMEQEELHKYRLAEKYATIWRSKTQKGGPPASHEYHLTIH